jgi:hypothetical protein
VASVGTDSIFLVGVSSYATVRVIPLVFESSERRDISSWVAVLDSMLGNSGSASDCRNETHPYASMVLGMFLWVQETPLDDGSFIFLVRKDYQECVRSGRVLVWFGWTSL